MKNLIVFAFALTVSLHQVLGWGKEGHQIIAQIAQDRISTNTQNAVNAFTNGETLAYIAPLPDDYDHTEEGRWSAPCHYCNLPRDATSFKMSYCPNFCVVKSIQNYTNILSSEADNPVVCDYDYGVEPCALEFLVHFVGDVHQPLHVGYGYDEGGNTVKVKWFGDPTELHKVWDDLIIERWQSDLDSAVQELEEMIQDHPNMVNQFLSVTNPILWANESFGYVLSTVYDFDGSMNGAEPNLGDQYYTVNLPIVKDRLIAAGVRLGLLLDTILGGSQ